MRLAYAESAATGTLTPQGLKAMERSYAVDPVSADLTAWRIRFAAEHWRELTPSLRRRVAAEIEAAHRYPLLFGPPEAALDVAADPALRLLLEGRSSAPGRTGGA